MKAFLVIYHVGMSSWYDYFLYFLQNMKIKHFVFVLCLFNIYLHIFYKTKLNIDKPSTLKVKSKGKGNLDSGLSLTFHVPPTHPTRYTQSIILNSGLIPVD